MQTDKACLHDILAAMQSAVRFVNGRTYEQFVADDMACAAVERQIEIMGEATKRLSMALRDAHPHIPWRNMAGMRDLLIHAYEDIELAVVYEAVTNVIPPLIPTLQSIVHSLPDPQ